MQYSYCVAQYSGDNNSLLEENTLYHGDLATALCFSNREMSYTHKIGDTYGHFWYGISDKVTSVIDINSFINGVSSLGIRYKILSQKKYIPFMSFESMLQSIHGGKDVPIEKDKIIKILRRGVFWYNHINSTWKLTEQLHFHISGGATYSEYLDINNNVNSIFIKNDTHIYENMISGDYNTGVSYIYNSWLSLYLQYSYGSTFNNKGYIPLKTQISAGLTLAPFDSSKVRILKRLRIETSINRFNFKPINKYFKSYLIKLHWQWSLYN